MNVKVLEIKMSEASDLASLFSRSVPGHTSSNVMLAAGILISTYAAKRNGIPVKVFLALAQKLWEETTDPPTVITVTDHEVH